MEQDEILAVDSRNSDSEYDQWLAHIQNRFLGRGTTSLFMTDAKDIWQAYLEGFRPENRQAHNCSACRGFVRRFGCLVTLDERGRLTPAFWEPEGAPSEYKDSVAAARRKVLNATVTGVFLSAREIWGKPVTGTWSHLSATPHVDTVYRSQVRTAG